MRGERAQTGYRGLLPTWRADVALVDLGGAAVVLCARRNRVALDKLSVLRLELDCLQWQRGTNCEELQRGGGPRSPPGCGCA